MKIVTLVALVVVTGAVGAGAFVLSNKNRAVVKSEVAGEAFLPDLINKVNDVAEVSVKKGDKVATFKRTAEGWEVTDKGGYPAKIEKVKEVLLGLAQLRKVEPKTSKPENYAKIGVEDPIPGKPDEHAGHSDAAPTSSATLVTLKDDKGQTITSVIVGNSKWDGKPGVYIRKAGEAQSWLADGQLTIPGEFTGWVEPQALNIPRDRIKSAETRHPDGTKTLVTREKKEDQNFTVHDVPAGSELMGSNAGDAVGAALAYVTFEDVRPVAQVNFEGIKTEAIGKPGPSSEFLTFDGIKILVQTAIEEVPAKEPPAPGAAPAPTERTWAHFIAVYDEASAPKAEVTPEAKPGEPAKPADKKPEEVQKEVAELNSKIAKWAYQLPAYKASGFKTTVKNMLKDKIPAPPPSLNEGNTAAPLSPPLPGSPAAQPPATPPTTPPPTAQPPTTPPPTTPPSPQPEPKQNPELPIKPPADPPKPNPGGG